MKMLFKIFVDPKDLSCEYEDDKLSINEIFMEDGKIFIEISYPDPEPISSTSGVSWQQ
jgi:hypothetical protein